MLEHKIVFKNQQCTQCCVKFIRYIYVFYVSIYSSTVDKLSTANYENPFIFTICSLNIIFINVLVK